MQSHPGAKPATGLTVADAPPPGAHEQEPRRAPSCSKRHHPLWLRQERGGTAAALFSQAGRSQQRVFQEEGGFYIIAWLVQRFLLTGVGRWRGQ